MQMRVLMVCLTNPKDGKKGDTKLVKKRRDVLETMGCIVDVLYFEWSFYRSSIGIKRRGAASKSVDIVARLNTWRMLCWLLRADLFARKEPVQTWVSFGIADLHRKDLVHIFSSYTCIHFFHIRSIGLWKLVSKNSRVVVDLIDSYTLNIGNRLKTEDSWWRGLILREEYRRIRRMETNIERYILNSRKSAITAVAEADLSFIGACSTKKVVVPVGINREVLGEMRRQEGNLKCVFFGNLDYEPNIKACNILLEVASLLRKRGMYSKIDITIAGRNVGNRLRKKLEREGIQVKSPVKDMFKLVHAYDLAIMPMVSGSGMQSKVLEAIAWGVVVMTTRRAAGPVGLSKSSEYIEIESAEDIVVKLSDIMNGEYRVEEMRRKAHSKIGRFEWVDTCRVLVGLYKG